MEYLMNEQLVGGMFGLTDLSGFYKTAPFFLKDKDLLTVNARSSIKILVSFLRPSRVWLPSFLCDVVFSAVQDIEVQFYEVNGYLQVSGAGLEHIQPGDLIIFIDYFGFPFDPSLAKRVKERGGWILEDASQALLSSHVGENSDFVVFSPRKFLGVPDGGILRNNTNLDFSGIQLNKPPSEWWLKAFSAVILRGEFDRKGGDKKWFQLFQEIDHDGPTGFFKMSELSITLLEYNFDYSVIVQKRIENYKILDHYLNEFVLFPELSAGVVPLGYPVQLENRDAVRKKLFENNIYPPVHWPISTIVPNKFIESHHLADTVMTLVCDQRYDAVDMERTAKIILQKVKNG
jgi:dTDP-4-amino-4,6-dideoxygalactose transaminase